MKIPMRIVIAIVALAVGTVPAAAFASGHGNHGHSQNAPGHNKSTTSGSGSGSSSARSQAQKQCRQERASMGEATFDKTYGTNKNGKNAFGKCVSHRSSQDQSAQQSSQTSAEKTCRSEQNDSNFSSSHNGETFDQFYGSGNAHNAFGKCVSSHARSSSQQSESSEVKAEDNAARQCRTEQTADPAAFKAKYGTNANKSNAFGKCVSQKAHQQEQQSGSGSGGGSGSNGS
jgi:hypothetical protein